MELSATQEIIVQLKAVKEERKLSIPSIVRMVEETGTPVSETAIRRVFATNSETNDSFNYEHTLRPICQALLVKIGAESDEDNASVKAFLAINQYKDEKIESLQQQIEHMREQFETRVSFLLGQIELKDQRMDRKDQMIEKLLNQVLTCSHCPVGKKDGA